MTRPVRSSRWSAPRSFQYLSQRYALVMAERRKLIVVSNRGPVSYSRQNGERVAKRGGGGLVTALRGVFSYHGGTWISSAISEEARPLADETIDETARERYALRLRPHSHADSAYGS